MSIRPDGAAWNVLAKGLTLCHVGEVGIELQVCSGDIGAEGAPRGLTGTAAVAAAVFGQRFRKKRLDNAWQKGEETRGDLIAH